GRIRSQREDLAVVWIHRNDDTALRHGILELFFRCLLQVEIDRSDEIASGNRVDDLDLILNAPATVDDDFAVTVTAAQIIVVDLFDTTQSDDVAGFETLVLHRLLLQLFGTDFTDIAKNVCERTIIRILALRLLLDAQLRVFEIVCLDPRDVAWRCVLFHADRFKRRHRFYDFEIISQDVFVEAQPFGKWTG